MRESVSADTARPRLVDSDDGGISVRLDGKDLRVWEYRDEAERRIKMLCAREYIEGWCDSGKPLWGRRYSMIGQTRMAIIMMIVKATAQIIGKSRCGLFYSSGSPHHALPSRSLYGRLWM